MLQRLAALAAVPGSGSPGSPGEADGEPKRSAMTVIEAFTGEPLGEVPEGTEQDVADAFERARAAQQGWAAWPVRDRAAVLERFHDLVWRHQDELLDIVQAETGKARVSATEEVLDVANNAAYYARRGPALLREHRRAGLIPGVTRVYEQRVAKGVIGIIAPWNYPLTLPIGDALPALLAGNAVVLKPDAQTPFTSLRAAELLIQAGLPADVFQVTTGRGSVVGTAITQRCDMLMFTGSTATGRLLAGQCAQRLIEFSAELGGKNPMIVTSGANLNRAVEGAVRACFSNTGQLCISIERIYVQEQVAARFTELFTERIGRVSLAAGYQFGPEVGSLISAEQLATTRRHVDDAVAKGATVLAGGKARPDLGPYFYEPTVLSGVTDEMDCCRGETFGPVVSIYPVSDVDEAVRLANDSEYGLNASVWAGSVGDGRKIAERLRSGTVNVNEGYSLAYGSTDAPMGGMGASGMGRRHGSAGLLKYTEARTVAAHPELVPLSAPPGISQAAFARISASTMRARNRATRGLRRLLARG
jgi:succinate-semialdehyde dehydrogenase/glutarate-semialdehyde dehydrogenase